MYMLVRQPQLPMGKAPEASDQHQLGAMLEAEVMLPGPARETGLRAHPQDPAEATEVQ